MDVTMKTCRYPTCESTIDLVRGLCNKHYKRWQRGTLGLDDKPRERPVEEVMGLPLTHANVNEIVRRVAATRRGTGVGL